MSKSEARLGADAGVGRHPGFEEHDDRPSTRFKDLIDLVAIQAQCRVAAAGARQALENESRRRGLALPSRFDVPDYELWKRGYAGEARRTVGLTAPTVDDALDVVRPFLIHCCRGARWGLRPPHWPLVLVSVLVSVALIRTRPTAY